VDVCGLWRVDHPNDLQLDARGQDLELPTATTEQHRDLLFAREPHFLAGSFQRTDGLASPQAVPSS
jgi:hypothetical protein